MSGIEKSSALGVLILLLCGCGSASGAGGALCTGGLCGQTVERGQACYVAPERVDQVLALPVANKLTVIDFWDTKCPPCLAAMPKWQALWDRLDQNRAVIVGVSMDRADESQSGIDRARSAIREDPRLKVTFPMLHDGEALVLQEIYDVGPSLPITVVVEPDGRVVFDSRQHSADALVAVENLLVERGMLR